MRTISRDRRRHVGPGPLPRRDADRPGAARCGPVDGDEEIGISPVALAETAHVLRTQYGVEQADIVDGLIGLVQRGNIRILGGRTDIVVEALVRARALPGRPIPDALIVAAAQEAGAATLATFDREQGRYGVVTREP